MIELLIATDGSSTDALELHLARFGCRIVERTRSGLRVEFPHAASDRDAVAEARMYLSLWRRHRTGSVPSVGAA